MNWLEFAASALETLAWPAAAVWLAFLLRDRVLDAIGQLTGIEGFGIKADFERKASRIQEQVEDQVAEESSEMVEDSPTSGPLTEENGESTPQPKQGDEIQAGDLADEPEVTLWPNGIKPVSSNSRRMKKALDISTTLRDGLRSPRSAVLDSWRLIEDSIRELYQLTSDGNADHEQHKLSSVAHMTRTLEEKGFISDETYDNVRSMYRLRSSASRDPLSVSETAARNYASSAHGVLKLLGESFLRAPQN